MVNLKEKLGAAIQNKTLVDTDNPDFLRTPWEQKSNGAMVCIVWSWTEETGPVATPAVWMSHFEETQNDRINRSIQTIQEQIQTTKDDLWKQHNL